MMLREVLLIILCTILIVLTARGHSAYNYPRNLSNNLKTMIGTSLARNSHSTCRNLSLCHLLERLKTTGVSYNTPGLISSLSAGFREKRSDMTSLQAKSYYSGGYGGGSSPAYYPAFDPISVLASLAFLAFLLQSFTSLFDRSRSIIPAVVSSRDSSPHLEAPDPVRLIMRALDEYEMLNNDIILENQKKLSKLS